MGGSCTKANSGVTQAPQAAQPLPNPPAPTQPSPEPPEDAQGPPTPRNNGSAAGHLDAAASSGGRKLTILHFNDVYNIEAATTDPVGGAARLAQKVREFQSAGANPLVTFGGDAFNPSLMSIVTLGQQMVEVMNEIGVHVAVLGNHDFDYGTKNLLKLAQGCKFPWLMANVLDPHTGKVYANADAVWMQEWNGIKVGIIGLVEQWFGTMTVVDPKEVVYQDFIEVGRQHAIELRAQGAEVVIALTHNVNANDIKIAAEIPEIDLVLGGHEHTYEEFWVPPHNHLVTKAGMEFQNLCHVTIELAEGSTNPKVTNERIPIVQSIPEDPGTKAVVDKYGRLMGDRMDDELVDTLVPLDGTKAAVRTRESNLGNFVADVFRLAARADVAIVNGGQLRSYRLHPEGTLKMRDVMEIFPYLANSVVIECTGEQVVKALENGVSRYPIEDGRFPQVSGLRYAFDPSREAGERIVQGSVYFMRADGSPPQPLELGEGGRTYTMATSEFMKNGMDGYEVFKECKVLVDAEAGVVIPTALRNHFMLLEIMSTWDKTVMADAVASKWRKKAAGDADLDGDGIPDAEERKSEGERLGTAVYVPEKGSYAIAPKVEGRITIVGVDAAAA